MATTPQTNATLAEIADAIREGDDFVICGHVNPDGDCIGSQLALYHALTALGKTATCVLVKDEPIAVSLSFMPGVDALIAAEKFQGACKVFIGVDVPTRERVGVAACALLDAAQTSITIDHHADDATMCEHVYVDPDSASASILVWQVVRMLMEEPPRESAQCAFTGLVTDTGGFRFQNSNADAFAAASDLVSFGADPSSIATRVFQSRSVASLRLEAASIGRIELLGNGQAAISWISQSDIVSTGAVKADGELLIDCVRSIRGVRVACMLREQDGCVRGNLRSKDGTDVSALAREFGGGGHKAAAGFTLELPIAEAFELLKGKLEELVS